MLLMLYIDKGISFKRLHLLKSLRPQDLFVLLARVGGLREGGTPGGCCAAVTSRVSGNAPQSQGDLHTPHQSPCQQSCGWPEIIAYNTTASDPKTRWVS